MSKQDLPPEAMPPDTEAPAPDDWVAKTYPCTAEDVLTIHVPTDATPPPHWDAYTKEDVTDEHA
jgi:hypothetical protein